MARIFIAGASGLVGQQLVPMLVKAGHQVTGTTRTEAKTGMLRSLGSTPVVVDVFDAEALRRAMATAEPEVVIHQVTSLPDDLFSLDKAARAAASRENARMRSEGTPSVVAAARAVGARRLVAQSIVWIYAPGREPHVESDRLDTAATGIASVTVQGVLALEKAVLEASPLTPVVLRYGVFYGPGTGNDSPPEPAAVHVNAAARAALLAVDRGEGVYNVAEPSAYASSDRARRDLGWDPALRT
jgi:nucleoside-diphosphate-sugar epimerase